MTADNDSLWNFFLNFTIRSCHVCFEFQILLCIVILWSVSWWWLFLLLLANSWAESTWNARIRTVGEWWRWQCRWYRECFSSTTKNALQRVSSIVDVEAQAVCVSASRMSSKLLLCTWPAATPAPEARWDGLQRAERPVRGGSHRRSSAGRFSTFSTRRLGRPEPRYRRWGIYRHCQPRWLDTGSDCSWHCITVLVTAA